MVEFAVRIIKPEGKGVVFGVFVLQLGVVGRESEPVPPQAESSAAWATRRGAYDGSETASVTFTAAKTINYNCT